jgi:hypothetical protein
MARLQVLVVGTLWLLVIAAVVRARVRKMPHRHWLAGLETLRGWDQPMTHGQRRL